MASGKSLDDLNLTTDELKRLTEALKKEEFRKLLVEYAEEISDPENRKKNEAEIAALEAERGHDVQFVHPEPGYVIKTTADGNKAFINICTNNLIAEPSFDKQISNGKNGVQWKIPHSFAPPREDHDKAKNTCKVFDVVFHPDTYRMGQTNARFKKMLHDTALEGIEKQFNLKLDKVNLKFPNINFKGSPTATVIRTPSDKPAPGKIDEDLLNRMPDPYNKTSSALAEENVKENVGKNKGKKETCSSLKNSKGELAQVPQFTIVHSSDMDIQQYREAPDAKPNMRPKEIVIKVNLPLLKSASSVDLDVFEQKLSLESDTPAKYKLDIDLPYPVFEDQGTAKFDKSKQQLIVTLPVQQLVNEDCNTIPDRKENLITENNEIENQLIEVLESNECNSGLTNKKDNLSENSNVSSKVSSSRTSTTPEFTFHQVSQFVTFVIKVRNVVLESIVKTYPVDKSGLILTFYSLGGGGFPIYYKLCILFVSTIIPQATDINISPDNFVCVLKKEENVVWTTFMAGLDTDHVEVRIILN